MKHSMKQLLQSRVRLTAIMACCLGGSVQAAPPCVTLKQIEGTWWTVSPDGKPFVSIGINHVEPQLLLGPHNLRQSYAKYGADLTHWNREFNPDGAAARKWIAEVKSNFDRWGFDTFAFHTAVPFSLVKDTHYFIARIRSASLELYCPIKEYLDPFTDAFAARVDEACKGVAMQWANEPRLLGYALVDLPPWQLKNNFENPWVNALQRLDADTPGKQMWIEVLRQNYASPAAAEEVYTLGAYTWEALARHTEWQNVRDANKARRDVEAMLTRIIERWCRLHHDSIRKYDAHHLILGDKVLPNAIPGAWPVIGKYYDLINVQWYATFDQQKALLADIHAKTGKPILLGDSSFSFVKPYQDGAKGVHVASQDAVGDAYFDYMKAAMAVPYVIGWHYCGYMEGQRGMQSPDTAEDRQNGFLDPFGRPFEYTLKRVTEANHQAQRWHEQSAASAAKQTR